MTVALLATSARPAHAAWAGGGRDAILAEIDTSTDATLGFATGDMRAPASLFGHTFIIFHGVDGPQPDSPLLEFAGDVRRGADHFRAVFTRIPGRFQLTHLSHKQREYATEGRSLWLYPLRLDAARHAQLRALARDASRRPSDYTFLRFNCSHHLLDLIARAAGLERSAPEWPHVTPEQTLRWLDRAGLLGMPRFVPAPRYVASHAMTALRPTEQRQTEALLAGLQQLGDATPVSVAQAAAAAAGDLILQADDPFERHRLLRLRADAPTPAAPPLPPQPLQAAGDRLIGVLVDAERERALLSARLGFRGLERQGDAIGGFALIEYGAVDLLARRNEARVTRVALVNMESTQPASRLASDFTQVLRLQYLDDSAWLRRSARQVELGFGRGLSTGNASVALSALPVFSLRWVRLESADGVDLSLSMRTVLAWTPTSAWRVRASGEWGVVNADQARRRLAVEARWAPLRPIGVSAVYSRQGDAAAGELAGVRLSLLF